MPGSAAISELPLSALPGAAASATAVFGAGPRDLLFRGVPRALELEGVVRAGGWGALERPLVYSGRPRPATYLTD